MARLLILIFNFLLWIGIFTLLSTCGVTGVAEGRSIFELRKAAIEAGSYRGTNHDAYLQLDREGEELQHTTSIILDADLVCSIGNDVCLYWNNEVASKASSSQYRYVHWDFRLGLALGSHLEMGFHHYSAHELDRKSNHNLRFPLENVLYIQLKFVDRPRRSGY